MIMGALLAHSAPDESRECHLYADHVAGAVMGARTNAEAVARHMRDPEQARRFVAAVVDGTTFHDLGKLDPDNQSALGEGRSGRMRWDHVDAGVAHLLASKAGTAAWIVRAHHAPGLPCYAEQFLSIDKRRLRGGRRDDDDADALTARTDRTLSDLLALHAFAAGEHAPTRGKTEHGLFLRLALSCLVDGDHADAAAYKHGRRLPEPPPPRWAERLARLDAYVASLPRGGKRQADRDAFYRACRESSIGYAMVACDGPVGIGKTTAVTAWLLRRAMESGARRLFVVAPYTTILSQTAETLRKALLLPDEQDHADAVIAEHHHRAEFSGLASRDLALLWRAPIIVTTSVQFFETLAACEPARLRKLQGLPGSVIFLDEAHASLSAPLWRQNWAWMRELASTWGCSFVFASGSLARVWEHGDLVSEDAVTTLPDLVDSELGTRLADAEHDRVRYATLGRATSLEIEILSRPGPRIVVFNTVQTAAVMAKRLREKGASVLHLSTALCPDDRALILAEVKRRLDPNNDSSADWTLVATSLVEAGIDLSFRTGFRERFSASSLIQIGGRVNRRGAGEQGWVYDFLISQDELLTTHPEARAPAAILEWLFTTQHAFDGPIDAADVVTCALCQEVRDASGTTGELLVKAEADKDYPKVAQLGRLIDADMAFVVVKPALVSKLESGMTVSTRALLDSSVSLWRKGLDDLGLQPLRGRPDLYLWPHAYDASFLGYMEGALKFRTGEAFLI
jgi:CRISPR-associated endonuclease/helicase Cas3